MKALYKSNGKTKPVRIKAEEHNLYLIETESGVIKWVMKNTVHFKMDWIDILSRIIVYFSIGMLIGYLVIRIIK